jgi:hypothetical protein
MRNTQICLENSLYFEKTIMLIQATWCKFVENINVQKHSLKYRESWEVFNTQKN